MTMPAPHPPAGARVVVFASASQQTSPAFMGAAEALGAACASAGVVCVNGGGKHGGMGALNAACDAAGGKLRMVIHKMFIDRTQNYETREGARVQVVVAGGADLAERKKLLMNGAQAVVVLPGGCGTWDELCEVICEVQLGFRDIPICLVNTDGYYGACGGGGGCGRLSPSFAPLALFRPSRPLLCQTASSRSCRAAATSASCASTCTICATPSRRRSWRSTTAWGG